MEDKKGCVLRMYLIEKQGNWIIKYLVKEMKIRKDEIELPEGLESRGDIKNN